MDDAPQPRRRVPRSFRAVAIGGAALGLVIVAVALSLYLRYIRYERVAARHLPVGTVVAARLDVEQVALYEPARRHLVPLLGGPARTPRDAEATLGRLEERTGLKRSDLREIVIARGIARADWVIVLGGIFPRGTSTALLAAALGAEDPSWVPSPDGSAVLHRDVGVAVGRGADGCVLVASSERVLATAREPTDTAASLGLPATGPGGIALRTPGIRELAEWPPVLADQELPALLGDVTAILGVLSLGERTDLTVTLTDDGHGAGAGVIRETLAIAKGFDRTTAGPVAGLVRAAAERAVVPPPARGTATVTLTWERGEVDQWFSLLAEAIQDHWH